MNEILCEKTLLSSLTGKILDEVRPFVIYYKSNLNNETNNAIDDIHNKIDLNTHTKQTDLINKLEKDTECYIDICCSWTSIMLRMGLLSELKNPIIFLIDNELFENKYTTLLEMIDMISTMHRCMITPKKMCVGVVVQNKIDAKTIKTLQETEVLGLVPGIQKFGYEKSLAALKEIINGRKCWNKDINDLVMSDTVIKKIEKKGIRLTERQKEVLELICKRGLSNKKIATILKISESTVKLHVSSIMKEYGVRNRIQLVLAVSHANYL
jgi:DNA-binding NarL/FixJ family response regulator